MSATKGTSIGVDWQITLEVYYDREGRSWWAFYADRQGNQLGNAWFGFTRDEVLVHRPPTPEIPQPKEIDA